MESRPRTTTGKVKVGLAFDPDIHRLLLDMAGGAREQAHFLSELILAEARRRQGGDMQERLRALEEQVAALAETQRS